MQDRIADRRGRSLGDLRLSITDECNFRCTYCMPKDLFAEGHPFLPPERLISLDEAVRSVRILCSLGVRKVKITGGEPLLRPMVVQLVAELSKFPQVEDLALITNGFHLERLAVPLREAGLQRLTVSADSINEETFARMSGRAGALAKVLEGIDAAKAAGFTDIKINTVVQRGVNDSEIEDMTQFFVDRGCTLRFIEYMDVGKRHLWDPELSVPSSELRARLDARFGLEALPPTHPGETATRFSLKRIKGEVGFISSVTEPFCSSCNRLRMSAEGMLYRCLFSGIGMSMKKLLAQKDDEAIRSRVAEFWRLRDDNYSEMRAAELAKLRGKEGNEATESLQRIRDLSRDKVEMYRMGG